MKFALRFVGIMLVVMIWFWVVVVQVPVLLTSGGLAPFVGIMLLALGVILPICWVVRRIKSASTEGD
jgi:hypothetical protein